MKKELKKQLFAKNSKELQEMLDKKAKELFSLKMDKQLGKLKNVRSLFHLKKEMALIKTILSQKETR
jgi:ribosomal protein L29